MNRRDAIKAAEQSPPMLFGRPIEFVEMPDVPKEGLVMMSLDAWMKKKQAEAVAAELAARMAEESPPVAM